MKKAISLLICIVMLVTLASVSVSAQEYLVSDLGDFGQQNWVIEGKTENPPIADGVIDPGEYTLEVKDMNPLDDATDDRFFCIDPATLDVENFNLYFSYDDNSIYIGAEITETETLDGEDITFYLSCNHKNFLDGIAVYYVYGGVPNTSEAEAFNTAQDGNVITYELIIRRTALADYIGAEDASEITEFSFLLVMGDDRDVENYPNDYPEMWFGCMVPREYEGLASSADAAEAEGKLWGRARDGRRFPHMMTLGEAPANTEPVQTAPTESAPTTQDAPDAPAVDKGCSASILATVISLVAALGTCTAFVVRKK